LRSQPIIRRCIQKFPGIRSGSINEQLLLGQAALEKAQVDPNLIMEINREVALPD